jgi:DNA polymerase III subunit delta'
MSWSTIRGHERLVASFTHAVACGRLAHAYLFVGPRGVGKTLCARELARALLCEAPPPGSVLAACDRCQSCILVSADTHPDFFTVRRPEEKNELPIDLMQELCRNFTLKTARGHGKVALLEDADDLNEESANCFLKTLEEPPPRSVFILIGTDADQQLATIRSRCQLVRFAPLPAAAVRDVLAGQGISDPALLERLQRLSAGSPGQALALAEETLWQARRSLLTGLAGAAPDSMALARGLVAFAEEAGKESAPQRRRVKLVLRLLVEALGDVVNLHLGAPLRSCGPDEQTLLHTLAQRASTERILAMIERCLETEVQLDRYVQISLVVEALIDSLVQTLRAQPAAAG